MEAVSYPLIKAPAGSTEGVFFSAANGPVIRCVLGRGGIVDAAAKAEGDGCTPAGVFPLRYILYRQDRVARPSSKLPVMVLSPNDGWCDAPGDPAYNRSVKLPYAASHEALWREDHVYDLVMVIGHNDNPVVPGKGSAIFLHLMHEDGHPTAGCVAVSENDFRRIATACDRSSALTISIG